LKSEGERAQAVAEETGLYVHRGVGPHSNRPPLENFAHAPSSGEGNQDGNIEQHFERSRFEDVRIEMEPYLALFEPDRKAGGYVVTFPDFGYGATQGETDEEAMEMAQDLLILTIRDFIRESTPLPKPKRHRGSKFRSVELPALQAAKVDLYAAFLESGLKKAEFARGIGIPKTHIDRLFSLRHHSRLDQIEAAFAALGKRLHVEARNAA
jgi:antitoxin HicB